MGDRRCERQRPDTDADRGRQAGRGDEGLDEPGDDEPQGQADDDGHPVAGLLDDGVAPAAILSGGDDRPAQLQADSAGDDDRRDLEQPVGQDQAPEGASGPVLMHERTHDPDAEAVDDEHRCGEHAGGSTAGEGEQADLDVVGLHLGCEHACALRAVVVLELVSGDQLLLLGRHGDVERLGRVVEPQAGRQCRTEEQQGGEGDRPPRPGDRQWETNGEERDDHALSPTASPVDHLTRRRHPGTEPADQRPVAVMGPHVAEVGRGQLVEAQQLLGLGQAQPAGGDPGHSDQLVETVPGGTVGSDVAVDVHHLSVEAIATNTRGRGCPAGGQPRAARPSRTAVAWAR